MDQVTPGLTSIIIPTYQHAAYVCDAVDCALAQSAPVEVLVVDDGSTDDTMRRMLDYCTRHDDPRVRYYAIPHAGVAAARNHGLDHARGEFVTFLDADDTITPDKVAKQLAAMRDGVDMVLCDVLIQEVNGRAELASKRYDYAAKMRSQWLAPQLGAGNFIPMHSPLVRASVLEQYVPIRFRDDVHPEDWHFWYAVAEVARARYIPDVLAAYRKRPGGRNTKGTRAAQSWPGAVAPLRLNLGCGTPGKESWHPLPGFVNLDKSLGWTFESGLREFADGTVAGITVSHALMFVAGGDWPDVFAEFARVLAPGGVVRITEDATDDRRSRTYPHGWQGSEPARTLTSARGVVNAVSVAGLLPFVVSPEIEKSPALGLHQSWHGDPPHVFYVEGVKP